MRTSAFSFVLALASVGCSAQAHLLPDAHTETPDAGALVDAAPAVDAASPPDAARAPDAWVEPDAGPPPAFADLYERILVPRCRRCHIDEDGIPYAYRPRLTDVDTAYAALFDVPVETPWVRGCVPDGVNAFRVRAFDPETSMLAFLPTCYVRDADHDDLTAEELAEIRAWISAGANREPF